MEVTEKKKKKKMQLLHRKPNMNIPNDVIVEIFSWLPAKSLLRLRWTCKYLFDLITNRDHHHDDFIKMHLLHHSTTTRTIISPSLLSFCFMNRSSPNPRKLSQGYYLNYNDTNHILRDVSSEVNRIAYPSMLEHIHEILGSSSNGLILVMLSRIYSGCILDLCMLNPCTKEYRVLRHPLTSYREGETYGFGYDQTMDDYKVIRISLYKIHSDGLSHSEVEVYTLGTSSWRRIGPCPYQLSGRYRAFQWDENIISSQHGVFLNGAIYWMDFVHENIISFDIGKEKFQHVAKTPNLLNNGDHVDLHKLQVFEGSLCLVLKTKHHQNSLAEIWVMKDCTMNNNNNNYNESLSLWTKLLTIPDMRYFPIKPVRYTRKGEILMLNSHKDLVLYDPKNTSDPKTLRRIWEDRNHFSVLEVYTESLVSLNSRTYAGQD